MSGPVLADGGECTQGSVLQGGTGDADEADEYDTSYLECGIDDSQNPERAMVPKQSVLYAHQEEYVVIFLCENGQLQCKC